MTDPAFPDALPAQYRLHWYVLERVLGQGGFGITYLARDSNLDQLVAVKEYLPVDVASRKADGAVRSRTGDQHERYRWGLDRFIQEARTLARFDHPNIVRALSVFEANNTAYMVMRFEEGENFAALLERRRTLTESEIKAVLLPILDGLSLVHGAGFIHRDIKPENIHIRSDGTPVLLDFGSARGALGQSRTVTILVAPGYAPFEQYYANGEAQGPWTDIYGLGATCYRALAGVPPMDAISRSKGVLGSTREVLTPASKLGAGRYSATFLKAVDHALEFAETDRPQSVIAWRRELRGDATVALAAAAVQDAARTGRLRGPIVWATIGALIATAAAAWWLPPRGDQTRLALLEAQLAELSRKTTPPVAPTVAAQPKAAEPVKHEAVEKTEAPAAAAPTVEAVAAQSLPAPVSSARVRAAEIPVAKSKPAVQETSPRAMQKPAARTEPAKLDMPAPSVDRAPPNASESVGAAAARAPTSRLADTSATAPAVEPAAAAPTPVSTAANSPDAAPPTDDKGAFDFYRKRAEEGNADARFRLGEMYAAGRGVKPNDNQAYIWFGLAARAGHAGAKARQEEVAAKLQRAEVRQADRVIVEKSRPGS